MKELQLIQSALKAPKGQKNSFGNYKYRSCEDILEALKPLLAEQKCHLTVSDEIMNIGDRYYVKAEAMIRNEEGVFFITTAYAREPAEKKGMDSAQITGATSSYARKYALNGLFAIDDTKDADTMDNSKEPAVKKEPGFKMPSRASLNKTLLACKIIEEVSSVQVRFLFTCKLIDNVMEKYTNKQGEKTPYETWGMLFDEHFNRVEGRQPINANDAIAGMTYHGGLPPVSTNETPDTELNEGLEEDFKQSMGG